MITALYSVLSSAFVVDYFKDMILGFLVVLYFAVLFLTRPHIEKDERALAQGRRAAEAAAAAKVLAQ